MGMTEFGREVWVLAAKRRITSQRALARLIEAATGKRTSHDTVRNYLFGRTRVSTRFLHQLDKALGLDEGEKDRLAQIFAWGQTTKGEPRSST